MSLHLKKRTLENDLSISVLIATVVVASALCWVFINFRLGEERRFLEQRADTVTQNLVSAASVPIWNMSKMDIEAVVGSFATKESVVEVKVSDISREYIKRSMTPSLSDIIKASEIEKNGEVIGRIQVRFSTARLNQRRSDVFLYTFVAAAVLIFLLVGIIRYVLARATQSLLRTFEDGMEKISAGDYEYAFKKQKYENVNLILDSISRLASRVRLKQNQVEEYERYLQVENQFIKGLFAQNNFDDLAEFFARESTIIVDAKTGVLQLFEVENKFSKMRYSHVQDQSGDSELADNNLIVGNFCSTESTLEQDGQIIAKLRYYFANESNKSTDAQLRSLKSLFLQAMTRLTHLQHKAMLSGDLERSEMMVQQISRTTHIMAHDVRKPFSMILMMYNELSKQTHPYQKVATVNKFMPHLDRSIALANGLIDDIMELGRKVELQQSNLPIGTVIQDAIDIVFSNEHKPRKIDFKYDWQHRNQLMVDRYKISRVVFNILENAAQAIKESGTITFKTKQSTNKITISIVNTGSKIPDDIKSQLFDPFFTSGKSNGTGLGLSIASKIVAAHGGRITVDSNDQETIFHIEITVADAVDRTSFEMTLPASLYEFRQSQQGLTLNQADSMANTYREQLRNLVNKLVHSLSNAKRKVSLLVVDDEQLYSDSVHQELQEFPEFSDVLDFYDASDFRSTLAIAGANDLDIIICDINLRDEAGDGLTLIKELRARGFKGYIIVNSNNFGSSYSSLSIEAGADQFYPKPLSKMQIFHGITNALGNLIGEHEWTNQPHKIEICLVEDSIFFIEAWKMQLANYEITTFMSGDEAIQAIIDGQVSADLLITDYYFENSETNGDDVARVAKENIGCSTILSSNISDSRHNNNFDHVTNKKLDGVEEFIQKKLKSRYSA